MNIAILGGGFSGIAAAYKLSKENKEVIILEKEKNLGGIASSYFVDDFWIEKYYHHIFKTDFILLNLISELDLFKKIEWHKTKMGIFYKNKIYNFTSPLDLLFFKPLSLKERIKFGMMVLKTSKEKDRNDLDKLNAEEWLVKKWGSNIYKIIFEPILKMKFGSSMDEISAAFINGRIKARSNSRSFTKEKLGYIDSGYKILLDSLESKLKERVDIKKDAEIISINLNKEEYIIKFRQNKKIKTIKVNQIINTLPIPIYLKLFKNIPKEYKKDLNKIKYQKVICVLLSLNKKLSDYYWINISSQEIPFGAIIEHTNFISPQKYKNQNLIYLVRYADNEDSYWPLSDKELFNKFFTNLKKIFSHLDESNINWYIVSKEAYATPIFTCNYNSYKSILKKQLRGVFHAGSLDVYPDSRNINNVIKSGLSATESLLKNEI